MAPETPRRRRQPRRPGCETAAGRTPTSHRVGLAPPQALREAAEPSEDDIRLRAYQRYLERGGGHGMDFDDWLEAEKELKK